MQKESLSKGNLNYRAISKIFFPTLERASLTKLIIVGC